MARPEPSMQRDITDFPAPPYFPLPHDQIFKGAPHAGTRPDWKILRDHFTKEGLITKSDALQIIGLTIQLLRVEPTLMSLQDPVTVVGDIHGQFYDLLKILDLGGNPEKTKYLFLGDYVDRGMFSIEVILLLYALKLNFPTTIFMLRGNHECRQMTSMFSFRTECLYKYDIDVYNSFMESFDCLPMACVVNNSFLAVHGGISPELLTLREIQNLNRFVEPARVGLQCDMLWSDPIDTAEGKIPEGFKNNETRGCSYFFGGEATRKFLKENDLVSIIRAHEAQKDGYKMQYWNGADFPSIITIFSAPNYCDCYKNKGAVIKFDNSTLNIQQYNYTKHPYLLPDFMDVFSWSIPFVIEKVIQMLYGIIKPHGTVKVEFDEKFVNRIRELEEGIARSDMNVEAIEKLIGHLRRIRESNECMITEAVFNDGKAPKPVKPTNSVPIIGVDSDSFIQARLMDRVNEKIPDLS